jgi:3-hydroxymyristoyl/3-hydroxydecanoyl-(acyl carrier protein) dehydratase
MQPSSFEASFTIPTSHPCTQGHFPGHPIVPGAFLLSQIALLIQEQIPHAKVSGFKRVKFLTPIEIGVLAQLKGLLKSPEALSFTIESNGKIALKGSAQITLLEFGS